MVRKPPRTPLEDPGEPYFAIAHKKQHAPTRIDGVEVKSETLHLDNLGLFSGRLRIGDPRGEWSQVVDAELPKASADVTVTHVWPSSTTGNRPVTAFLTLWLDVDNGEPVRWERASLIGGKPEFAVPIDSGMVLIADSKVTGTPEDRATVDRTIQRDGPIPQEVYLSRGYTAYVIPTGFGDGIYAVWKGIDAKSCVTQLVVDFRVLDVPEKP